jgi:hypothetical protein
MSEDRGQRKEVRCQMSEDRGQKTEVRGQRSEDRGEKTDVRKLTPDILPSIFCGSLVP